MMFFNVIPFEIRLEILLKLAKTELNTLKQVCKTFREEVMALQRKRLTDGEQSKLNDKLYLTIVDYMLAKVSALCVIGNQQEPDKRPELLKKIGFLIELGANVNACNSLDSTPLHAVHELGGDEELSKLLIEKYKADPEVSNSEGLKTYETAKPTPSPFTMTFKVKKAPPSQNCIIS